MTDITHQRLIEILLYDSGTGHFFWRVQRKKCSIGSRAGNQMPAGYRRICIDGVSYYEHRLAWLYVNGEWPSGEIDHKPRIKNLNAVTELRDVSRSQNQMNKSIGKNNISGVKGVGWNNSRNKWVARIKKDRQTIFLGVFDLKDDAIAVRLDAERRLFGEFSSQALAA
jgi:hypothetical protein